MPNTINDWQPALNQVNGNIGSLNALAVAGQGSQEQAIRTLCGLLTQNLTSLGSVFDGIIANGAISDTDKQAFVRQAYLDLSALQTDLSALTALLRFQYTDASGVFLFANETQLYGQTGNGIIGKFNTAVTNLYGQTGNGIIIRPT